MTFLIFYFSIATSSVEGCGGLGNVNINLDGNGINRSLSVHVHTIKLVKNLPNMGINQVMCS